ncbi:MAG: cytidylate kinase family protein [Parcubacteria group bacterium]|jgi:cytidylate kinase
MIITINGDEGSGKTTVAKKLAEKINFTRYTTGEIFREMSKKRGLSLVEYLKLGETDPSIDKEVDDYVIKLSKEQDNFIIDSRVAWHFIPNSIKIYLKVAEEEGAKRIYKEILEKNNRNETKKPPASVDYVMKKVQERRETDDKRYMQYYGINIRNKNNYDFVVDTTDLDPEQVFEKVLGFIQSKINEKSS